MQLKYVQEATPFPGRGIVQHYTSNKGTDVIFHQSKGLVGANCYIWFPVGSRNESPSNEGIAHLVEHLVFQKNSPRIKDCIDTIENLGGELNACTTKEYVCFELNALSSKINKMIPFFWDMVFRPDVLAWDVKKELKVIAEELREDFSDPEVIAGEKIFEKAFKYPLGHGVGGKISKLKELNQKKALAFYHRHFTPGQAAICIVAGGSFKRFKNTIEQKLSSVPAVKKTQRRKSFKGVGKINPFQISLQKEVDGCFLSYIWPGTSFGGKFRLELTLLDHMLCGGLSSYLFEELRTKRGLIYSASSQAHSFTDNGLYEIELFCQKSQKNTVHSLFLKLWKDLIHKDVFTEGDLEKAKNQVIGSWSIELDDIETRNTFLAKGMMFQKEIRNFDDLCGDLMAVSLYDIKKLLKWWGEKPFSTAQILPKAKRS
jgi:predicted Zn-dependent peptidase